MNVACEAMINPNDKAFRNYTDEAFLYGWCEDCGYGVILSDVDEVKNDIDKLYSEFCAEHGTEPLYAKCEISWKDSIDFYASPEFVTIKLSANVDEATDEQIFFYCDGIGQLISLAEFSGEDFVLIHCECFTNEL